MFEPILAGTLASGATIVKGVHFTDVWKGTVYLHSGPVIAYVKMLPANQTISELVCATLARSLDLDVPQSLLVKVTKTVLPNYRGWLRNEEERLVFGAKALQHPDFSKFIGSQQQATFLPLLKEWANFRPATAFDEWIANGDRHLGNLLYDAAQNRFWLIDHSHAFTGHQWKPENLIPSKQVVNRLLDLVNEDLSLHERYQWRKIVGDEVEKYQHIDAAKLIALESIERVSTASERARVENFLTQRRDEVIGMMSEKLGIVEL